MSWVGASIRGFSQLRMAAVVLVATSNSMMLSESIFSISDLPRTHKNMRLALAILPPRGTSARAYRIRMLVMPMVKSPVSYI